MASKDDTINTNLDLGLGLGLGLIISSNHNHKMQKQVSLKRDRSFPSLTLSLSPDDDQSSPDPKIDASCVSAVSSFSNSSVAAAVVKKETEEELVERTASMCSRAVSDDQEDEQGVPRKKLRLTKQQSATLELTFKQHSTLNLKQKQVLAAKLNLRPRQVEVWFQNRRARTKLKQTEEDCEVLKKCCETLTEENKRLQKELKALKLRARVYMKVQPPPTLTICPSCHGRIIASDHHFLNPLTHPSAAC